MDREREAREKLEDLKLSLRGLAQRLRDGVVKASQVIEAVEASPKPVKKGGIEIEERPGVAMTEEDPEFIVVLEDLCSSLVEAFFQEKKDAESADDEKLLVRIGREIGYGAADGKFDAKFFKSIKVLS